MDVNVYTTPRSLGLDNGIVAVEIPVDAGPRVGGLWLAGEPRNLLAETPDIEWETPWGAYRLRGGHRLWHAPEDPPWTCVPDAGDVVVAPLPHGLRIERPEAQTGLRRAIEVELELGVAAARLAHVVRNESDGPRTLAAWAITMLPLGGTAILPQRPVAVGGGWAPARALALWPGSSWADERLVLGDGAVLVRGVAGQPFKVGEPGLAGWAGYLAGQVLLTKRFAPRPELPHADLGCAVEVYASDRFLELETLGPLVELAPGEETRHEERWELRRVEEGTRPEDVLDLVAAA